MARIEITGGNVAYTDGGMLATVSAPLRFGHLGCKLLSTIAALRMPQALRESWQRQGWLGKAAAVEQVGCVLALALRDSGLGGIELFDTMRGGSDYWRPGKLLSDAARHVAAPVTFARLDELCPPSTLLAEFRITSMSFPEYAQRYAAWLAVDGRIDAALGAVVVAQARSRLAVFYCTDPFVPGYADPSEWASATPYRDRRWPISAALRDDGCHRVVLADLLARHASHLGLGTVVLELDPTRQRVGRRIAGPVEKAPR